MKIEEITHIKVIIQLLAHGRYSTNVSSCYYVIMERFYEINE